MSKETVEGTKIHVVSDETEGPRGSIENNNTCSIGAAVSSCADFHGRGYIDAVEIVDGKPVRRTTWVLDANKELEFLPAFAAEKISVAEVIRRFNDRAWCEANPHHPIAFMHFYAFNTRRLIDRVKGRKPGKLIRRENRFVIIDDKCPPELEAQFMKDLENGI